MRITPYPAPSQSELDKVKRVLFPASDDEDEVFHSLPLTGDSSGRSDEEEAKQEEEQEKDVMGKPIDKKERKKRKASSDKVGNEFTFKLDPEVETFREKVPAKAPSTPCGTQSSCISVLSPSPSRKWFDPPFKTPPSASFDATLKLSTSGAMQEAVSPKSNSAENVFESAPSSPRHAENAENEKQKEGVDETLVLPRIDLNSNSSASSSSGIDFDRTPPRSSTPLSHKNAAADSEKTPQFKTPPKSQIQGPPTTPKSKGKRRLFTNKSEQIDVLPSPEKKSAPYVSKMPKVKLNLKDATKQTSQRKAAKPKKPKRETAKDRAEAYRKSNRDKILRDMQKEQSTIEDLLEKRRQRRCERESQLPEDSQSPGRDRAE